MKLSEAIRKGSKGRNQVRGKFYSAGGCCALGAACDEYYGKPQVGQEIEFINAGLRRAFPDLLQETFREGAMRRCLWDDVLDWNDNQELSFEEIATKLEGMGL